jgi:hypothetical protein
MDLLAIEGGEEWALMRSWAEEERALFIAENGERATNFINSIARKQEQPVPTTNITMQNTPTPEKQEKKGLFRR